MLARVVKTAATRNTAVKAHRKVHTSRHLSSPIPFLSQAQLAKQDPQLINNEAYKKALAKYTKPASQASLEKAKKALEEKGHAVTVVPTKSSALSTLISLIPEKSTINLTGSTSHNEIGFIDYLVENTTKWDNLKSKMLAEKDPVKQAHIRRLSATSDYAISSVDAVTEEGEFLMADASGTRIVVAHAAGKVIFIVGSQKIVKDMDTAFDRLHSLTFVTESARMRTAIPGIAGSTIANVLIGNTAPFAKNRFHFLIVEEPVGF